jgi:hypothetical protein
VVCAKENGAKMKKSAMATQLVWCCLSMPFLLVGFCFVERSMKWWDKNAEIFWQCQGGKN